jgi:hypothetical protein
MFIVTEAAAIRDTFHQEGELSAAIAFLIQAERWARSPRNLHTGRASSLDEALGPIREATERITTS